MSIDTESGSFTFTAGANGINTASIDLLADQIKIMLVTDVPTPDADTIAGFSELRVGGYVPGFLGTGRKTLARKSVTREGRRSVFRAADPSQWTLAPGGTVVGAVVYAHVTSDGQSVPLFFLEMRTSEFPGGPLRGIPTNGSTFAIEFHADGVGYTQQ
jgi:hypothetical protein